MLSSYSDNRISTLVYWGVIVGSLVVAAWARFIDPVINPDGVKYVLAAEAFLRKDFVMGFDSYKWPTYSLVVALVSKLFSVSTETAAVLFNAVMRALAGVAFIRITRKFEPDNYQLILAGLVFVFYPGLNEVQSMIIRDFAYVCCFLWMAVFFLQQLSDPGRKNLIGFVGMGVLATAFRIEGVVFIAGLLLLYLSSGAVSTKWKHIGLAVIVIALPVLVYGVLMWIYDGEFRNTEEIIDTMSDDIKTNLDNYIAGLDSGVWASLVKFLYYPILIFMPIYKLGINLLEIITIGYVIVLLIGWKYRPLLNINPRLVLTFKGWKWIVGINLLMLIGFVLIKQIVTDRYPLSLALMLIIFVPFAVTSIYRSAKLVRKKRVILTSTFVGLLLVLNSVEGLDRFTSKMHLKEAGLWIKEKAGTRNRIYSNNRIVDYYSGKREVEDDGYYSFRTTNTLVFTGRWQHVKFMAVTISRNDRPGFYRNFRYRIGKEPNKIFESRKGAKVLIYDFRDADEINY